MIALGQGCNGIARTGAALKLVWACSGHVGKARHCTGVVLGVYWGCTGPVLALN